MIDRVCGICCDTTIHQHMRQSELGLNLLQSDPFYLNCNCL